LRHRQYRGGVEVLDALYARADPWNLSHRHEQSRFAATNALIVANLVGRTSLLEIGCGEGLQTRHFLDVAGQVTGIDGSATALARARRAMPSVRFIHGDFNQDLQVLATARYDLVTLCEVLYYLHNPESALRRAQALGEAVLVTIYEPRFAPLERLFACAGWQKLPVIVAGRRRWRAYVWRRASDRN
jgi:ubiquinone/menaquinone biosynthesis C-methylase UbiE